MMGLQTVGLIPARWGSTRFPGKMLVPISGKSLLRWTYESTCSMNLFDEVFVVTDDERIRAHVEAFGGRALMTSVNCASGTDRLIEAVLRYPELLEASIVVNVQGDEPCLKKETVSALLLQLEGDPNAAMATPIAKIQDSDEALDPSVVKCVADRHGNALYFSRAAIPHEQSAEAVYYKHIGVYAFRMNFLLRYGELGKTPLQSAEDLEQLKILEHGYRIKTVVVEDPCIGVNVPEDIKKVEQYLCNRSTSSSPAVSSLALEKA